MQAKGRRDAFFDAEEHGPALQETVVRISGQTHDAIYSFFSRRLKQVNCHQENHDRHSDRQSAMTEQQRSDGMA
jgi:hypothetical protein